MPFSGGQRMNRLSDAAIITVAASAAAVLLSLSAVVGAAPAYAEKCTNLVNYAGDPRSNAEINGIGATTGQCPIPMTGVSADVPGAIQGAVLGEPCANYNRFIFGQGGDGQWYACASGGTSSGQWVRSVAVIGTRPIGSSCTPGVSYAAQSPDGLGLVCGNAGWVPGP